MIRPLDDLPAAFRLLGPSPRPSSPQLAEEELSEEDQKLKEDLELMVTRAADKDAGAAATLAGHKKAVYSVKWAPTGEGSANAGKDASLATCVRRRRGARAARRAAAARHPRP